MGRVVTPFGRTGGGVPVAERALEQRAHQPAQRRGQQATQVQPGVLGVHQLGGAVAVDAFVHPGFLKFVRGDQPHPVVVSEFVGGDAPEKGVFARARVGPAGHGDERRVLHPAGRHRVLGIGRSDHRDVGVRVGVPPAPVVTDGRFQRGQQLVGGGAVLRLDQDGQRHLRKPVLAKDVLHLDELGVRRPGEFLDVVLVEAVGDGAIGIVRPADQHSRRTDDEALGQREGDVIGPEVRVKLAVGMVLVGVPPGLRHATGGGHFQHRQLRKPLADQVVVAGVAGPSHRARDPRLPGDFEGDGAAGRNGLRQSQREDRLVVGVVVVRVLPAQGGQEVRAVRKHSARQLHPSPLVRFALRVAAPPRRLVAKPLLVLGVSVKGRLRILEGVPVSVEPKRALRLRASVDPRHNLVPRQFPRVMVQACVDDVGSNPVAEGLANGLALRVESSRGGSNRQHGNHNQVRKEGHGECDRRHCLLLPARAKGSCRFPLEARWWQQLALLGQARDG